MSEKGKAGRPRVLHRKHIIELPEDFDIEHFTKMLAIHETASVVRSYVGTNVGAASVTVAAIVALLSFPPTQRMVTAFLAFIRTQIAAIARDIQGQIIPTPQEVVDTVAEGAEEVAKTAREVWDDINRRLNEELERQGILEKGADPGGTLLAALQELIDRIINDPLFGLGGGGGGPIIPNR